MKMENAKEKNEKKTIMKIFKYFIWQRGNDSDACGKAGCGLKSLQFDLVDRKDLAVWHSVFKIKSKTLLFFCTCI